MAGLFLLAWFVMAVTAWLLAVAVEMGLLDPKTGGAGPVLRHLLWLTSKRYRTAVVVSRLL